MILESSYGRKNNSVLKKWKDEKETQNNPILILFSIRWKREKFQQAFKILLMHPTRMK